MTALMLLGLMLLAAYLISCAIYPYATCPLPWCRSRLTAGDKRGHFRQKRPCRLHPGGFYRRLGARLIGRARPRD